MLHTRMLVLAIMGACVGDVRVPQQQPRAQALATTHDGAGETLQALALLRSDDVITNAMRALELLTRACDDGDVAGCIATMGSNPDVDIHRRSARQLWSRCRAGDAILCRRLVGAPLFADDNASCAAGIGLACDRVYSETHDVMMARRACDLGVWEACIALKDDPARSARAATLLEESCKRGYWADCAMQSFLGINKDEILVRRVFDLAATECLGGVRSACEVREPEPTRRALEVRMMGCALDPLSCNVLLSEIGTHSLPDDRAYVRRAYAISCLRLFPNSEWPAPEVTTCLDGAALQTDPAIAAKMRKKACELGNQDACKSTQP